MIMRQPAPIADRPLRMEDVPDPAPGPGEILVEVRACGICRTDLHVVEGELPTLRSPLVPGHQVVGRVAARGPDAVRFREGERVGIAWLRGTCGRCLYCATDRENLCERAEITGWHADGGYADYAVIDEDYAYPIPAGFDDVQAAPLLCAGIIGYRALSLAAVPPAGHLVPVALRNLARGGTLALAGIYMTPVPALDYEADLFYERGVRSVTANTRADGVAFLAEAA